MENISVLLVEDNPDLAGSLADYLSETGFEVDFAFNGQSCLELLKEDNSYQAIIMDIMMPVKDGLTTCRELRESYHINTPVLFLTARDSLEDKLTGFASGGDDYVVKPFAPEEIAVRLRALLKRQLVESGGVQQYADLRVDYRLREVNRQGQSIHLYELQFRLLALLLRMAPEPVSKMQLEAELWPEGPPGSDPLRIHIYNLRKVLDEPFQHQLIKTVHGRGYRIAIPE
ncbi:response regulator transcription factor [Aliamphritea ceti]|uniref:response regulator transcription factor n=1 Tax=Aliamphritea ceti TaxID=1524258 RepID=UPI0021C28A50|nr:response regulator transcription factor [Aliamphritea ceti]